MAEPLTDDDRKTLKDAAFGAIALVANAEPGFFQLLRESFAASGALADASGLVREVLMDGDLPDLPAGSTDELAAKVLPALRESVRILRAKAPDELPAFTATVLAAGERAAGAAHDVAVPEQAMLSKVREALGS
jgi:hypothetical protein